MKKIEKVIVYGGSFNPPGLHHERMKKRLEELCDLLIIVPCGPRPDKQTTNDILPLHRAVMTDRVFGNGPQCRVDLFDLENNTFTRTHVLDERYKKEFPGALVSHFIGTDIIVNGKKKQSQIHTVWQYPEYCWNNLHFTIGCRPGYEVDSEDRPPHSDLFETDTTGSSEEIRDRVFHRRSYEDMVDPWVLAYIERYGLYTGQFPRKETLYQLSEFKLKCSCAEEYAEEARCVHDWILPYTSESESADLHVVLGGDRTLIKTVKEHWRERIPFCGINLGHRGFLLNDVKENFADHFPPKYLVCQQLPLVYSSWETWSGQQGESLGVNEAYLTSMTDGACWIEVIVNGRSRIPKLVGDGILFASSQGSTGRASNSGATPIPAGMELNLLVGSNSNWSSVPLARDAQVEFRVLSKDRPCKLVVDAQQVAQFVSKVTVRLSRIAAAELCFFPGHDLVEKLYNSRFPM